MEFSGPLFYLPPDKQHLPGISFVKEAIKTRIARNALGLLPKNTLYFPYWASFNLLILF